ncbi:unnamed protein product [Lactuca virosa]|uniref:Uncharacterized protein n=1 Tax=Lactuca virosa TaxID=75947 RepID=A0AAU9PS92_9ASTR|nr:unnamed protein product [Lactuca virosa]
MASRYRTENVTLKHSAFSPSISGLIHRKVSVGVGNDAVLFAGISLVFGIALRHLLKGTRVPYTAALLVLGIAMGSLEYGTNHGLGKVGDGIRMWVNIDPDLFVSCFSPCSSF